MLTSAMLTHPVGELQHAMFPDKDLAVNLVAWLSIANAQVQSLTLDQATKDEAARYHVYSMAFTAIANRIATYPTSEGYFNDVERQWGQGRVDYWRARAKESMDMYNALTQQGSPVTASRYSSSVAVQAVW